MKSLVFFFTCLLVFQYSNAQIIAAYSGTASPSAATSDNVSATPLSRSSEINIGIGGGFSSSNWSTNNTIDTDDYIEWTVSAEANFSVTVDEISISYDTDDGLLGIFGLPPTQMAIRSSVDGYSSTIFSDTSVSTNGETATFTTSQTSTVGGSITYRLYAYNASTGLLNINTGTFDIEGGLGTVLGLDNTGITLSGTVVYDGLYYDGSVWTPNPPSDTTGADNALVAAGSYTISSDVEVNDLNLQSGSTLQVAMGEALTVHGDLNVDGTLELNSDSENYSSLIVSGTVTGDVSYKRHVNHTALPGAEDANDLIAAPVSGEAFNSFITNNTNIVSNGDNTLYLFGPFDKTSGAYITYSNTETALLEAGTGYRAASTDDGTFTFTGTVNTSTITKAISHSGATYTEWNLIGNPYPSYITLAEFLSTNTNEFDSSSAGIYGYDGSADDGWTIWNQAYSDDNPGAVITPGQGFFVSSKVGGGSITFHPSMRATGTADDFILGRSSNTVVSSHFKLNMTTDSKSYRTEFYFNSNASLGLDVGYDASIFGNTAPDFSIYSHLINANEGLPMAIQALGESDYTNVRIPLGVHANQGEPLTFSISDNSLPIGTDIYLEDNLTNTSYLLNTNNYTLTPSTDLAGTGRFYLNVTNVTLSSPQNTLDYLNIYNHPNEKTLVIAGLLVETSIAIIYDIQGREILRTELKSTSNGSQNIDVSHLKPGVYVVKLSNTIQNKTQKIAIR